MMANVQVESLIPVLRVANLEDSLPFYHTFGFEQAWVHQFEPGMPRLGCVQQGPVQIFLTEHAVAPVGAVVYVNVRGVDLLARAAAARGLEPALGPVDQVWGQREVWFTDPDGNVIRFGEPLAADE